MGITRKYRYCAGGNFTDPPSSMAYARVMNRDSIIIYFLIYALNHRWELTGNYPVFTVVMVIYHYVERIWRILVTHNFLYNIYNH